MTIITLRVSDKLLNALDSYAHDLHVPRAEYIRLAIENMNHEIKNKKRAERIKKISLKARQESMRINKEFNGFEDDSED